MTLTKQGAFTKKVTDLTDVPSQNMPPSEIKTYFQTPSDELKGTLNQLVDDLTISGARKIGVDPISGLSGSTIQDFVSSLKAITDKKTDNTGDHQGSWQGLTPQMIGAPEMNSARITAAETQLAEITTKRLKAIGSLAEFTSGDGVADDTQAFINAVNTYKTVLIPPPQVKYRINSITFTSLTGIRLIGIGDPLIVGIDNTKIILNFDSCTSVKLKGFKIGYETTPTVRTENIMPLRFYKCNFTKVEKDVEVFNSSSVGMIHVYCNNASVEKAYVHDTMADGINFSHCGRNIKVLNNTLENTGDDSIAVYFFQTADNTIVGEPDKFTKRVVINGNDIKDSKARGILLGGTVGATVNGNTIENTRAFGISAHYETSAVNYNQDFSISNNVVRNASQNGTDPNGQNAGIYVAPNNVRGAVKGNEIYNPKDIGIHVKGSADVKGNTVQGGNRGAYLGDWDTNTSFGEFSGNTVISSLLEGVFLAPRTARGWTVKNNEFIDCVDPANVGTTTGKAPAVIKSAVTGGLSIVENLFVETRGTQTLNSAIYLDAFGGAIVERNNLKAASGYSRSVLDLTSTANISNKHTERFSAIPTFGFWKIGDLVENTNPSKQGTAGSQYIVDGWRRITTGTGNVLGTDWVEMRITTGT